MTETHNHWIRCKVLAAKLKQQSLMQSATPPAPSHAPKAEVPLPKSPSKIVARLCLEEYVNL